MAAPDTAPGNRRAGICKAGEKLLTVAPDRSWAKSKGLYGETQERNYWNMMLYIFCKAEPCWLHSAVEPRYEF